MFRLRPNVPESERYGYVYQTIFTHPKTGEKYHYVGMHKSSKVDRSYVGSGTRLRSLIKKHGMKGNIRVHVICWQRDRRALNRAEVYFVKVARERFGESCINLSDGGDGGRMPDAALARMSKKLKGREKSEETRTRMSAAALALPVLTCPHCGTRGKGGAMSRFHFKNCLDNGAVRKPLSVEARENNSRAQLGKKLSMETRAKMSAARVGRKLSPEHVERIKEGLKGVVQPIVKCPHCGRKGGAGAMYKWHFENCRS